MNLTVHQRKRLREIAEEARMQPYSMYVAYCFSTIAARRGLTEHSRDHGLKLYAQRYYVNHRTLRRAVRLVEQNFQFSPAYPVRGYLDAESVFSALVTMGRRERFEAFPEVWTYPDLHSLELGAEIAESLRPPGRFVVQTVCAIDGEAAAA